MAERENVVGRVFGHLEVISEGPTDKHYNRSVNVRCKCGTEKLVGLRGLRHGTQTTCGCGRGYQNKLVGECEDRGPGGCRIILTRKQERIFVDESDYAFLSKYTWHLSSQGYAVGSIDGQVVQMHVLLAGCLPCFEVDHEDGNRTNNTRGNLRPTTRVFNCFNKSIQSNSTTGLKGVFASSSGKYRSQIKAFGKLHWLGVFDKREDAARAYDSKAVELHGDFAKTNKAMGLIK